MRPFYAPLIALAALPWLAAPAVAQTPPTNLSFDTALEMTYTDSIALYPGLGLGATGSAYGVTDGMTVYYSFNVLSDGGADILYPAGGGSSGYVRGGVALYDSGRQLITVDPAQVLLGTGRYYLSQTDHQSGSSASRIDMVPYPYYPIDVGGSLGYARPAQFGPAAVPEPSAWMLLGAGLIGVAGARRRRDVLA